MSRSFYKPQLDVLRFFAFFAVFNHHVLPRGVASRSWLGTLVDACGFGLSLFFVLSAYLITSLLLRERESTGTIQLNDFYLRRVLRIWPLYLLGLAIGVLRAYSHGVLDEQKIWFFAALVFAGNLVPSGGILMSHLWSISVEEQFYFFMPTIGKFGRAGLATAAALMIISAELTLVHFAHVHATLDTTVWFNSLVEFELFAAGILLALFDRPRLFPGKLCGITCVSSGYAVAFWVEHMAHLKLQGAVASAPGTLCLGYACLALACCLLVVGIQRLPAWGPLVYLGKISYGLYVFHLPAVTLVGNRLRWAGLNALASLGLTVVLASISYRVLERPFLLLKQRFEIVPTRPA